MQTRQLNNTMTIIFLGLLPLTISSMVTMGQHTHVTTGEVTGSEFTLGHVTTQKASSILETSEVQGPNIRADPSEAEATTPSRKHTLSPANQRATTSPTLSQFNSTTVGTKSTTHLQHEVRTSQTTGATNQNRNPTTTSAHSLELSSSNQGLSRGGTLTSQWTSVSTHLILTASTSTNLNDKSTSTSPVSGGDAIHSTLSQATTKSLFTHITETNKRGDPPENKSNVGGVHGKVVAWIIGGALVLMMVGFLAIFIQKRKIQKQQISTTDWAGPSPFLEGGANNGQVTLRSSNRISLSSFLPQRLSKRLSLLPETDEELQDIPPGTTFGDKHHPNTSGPQLEGSDRPNAAATQVKGTGDTAERSEPHPQTNSLLSTETSPEAIDPPEGNTAALIKATSNSLDN
ncbi:hypothetical protein INR49_010014 [Caranx melampygus]|nr:hypothetical protein INR49_010014 [Caranx melampygus]